jgi:fido (protein-threonine AMPylation protein)
MSEICPVNLKMSSSHKRQSLSQGPFEGLNMDNKSEHLGRSIRLMMLSTFSKPKFTIKMGDAYDYNILQETPDQLHHELRKYTSDVAGELGRSKDKEAAFDEHFTSELARMVYGSNMIEVAGGGVDITLKLCKAVFQGKEVPEDITERDSDYEELKLYLMNKNLPSGHTAVLRSRREIVQHAQAARFMIEEVCIKGKDLSQEIIRETHAILTYKIDINEQTPWIYYSGVYRTWNVRCGSHVFMDENRVPSAMREMIESLESDIKAATERGQIDPVLLASKYCHEFVNIHPFADGNGRMCRLILNSLLLKYSGGIVCIGQSGDDRQEYLRIAVAASDKEALKDRQSTDEAKPKNYMQLASFTLRHARDSMRKVRQVFKREN